MSGLHGTKESSVIDEEMLEKAVVEQGPQEQAGKIAKEEGLKYHKVTQLRLDYRSILKIDHLWQFTSLTKLQLDNNVIEKIQGLETLTNLVWLDLSFNNIKVIEGLDTLVKLQDLSLFNNRISVIENLDALRNLNIILLGNNLISQLDNVIYLRKFKNLRTLGLAGNPVCKDENYQVFVAAYLSDLVYLDYRLLDEQTREQGQYKYQDAIEKIKHNELQEEKAAEAQAIMEQDLQLHTDAFVEYLNGPHLFDSMYADDVDASKLAYLPAIATLMESFRTQLGELCMQIFEAGLAQRTQRQNEVECFFTCLQKAMADNQQRGNKIITDFERSRRQVMSEVQHTVDRSSLKDSVRNEIMQIRDALLTLELQLVAQVEDIVKEFESNITDIVGTFAEYVQGIFAQCRDVENQHHEKVLEISLETLERMDKNELKEDLPEDVQLLFVDKDTVINAVSTSHDIHLLRIDNREDELLTRINGWKNALMKSIHDEEVQRNRRHVSEIHKYFNYAMDQLEESPLPDHQEQE